MKWTPPLITAAVVLLIITVATVCFLPDEHAWAILGQIAGGAVKASFG